MLAEILKRPANIYINPDFVFKSSPYLTSPSSPFWRGEERQGCPGGDKGCGSRVAVHLLTSPQRQKQEELGASAGLPTCLTACTVPSPCSFIPSFWKGLACKPNISDNQGNCWSLPWDVAYTEFLSHVCYQVRLGVSERILCWFQ